MTKKNAHAFKPVTSVDVAKKAGVSQSTVSRAFSNSSKLSVETREYVFQVARELGYRPNAIARSLVSAQTKSIGIVKSATFNPMFAEMLTCLMAELQKTDYQVLYYEVARKHSADEILSRILQYRVEGIILLNANLSSEVTRTCSSMGIPVMQILRYSNNSDALVVIPDNRAASAMAVDHLWDKGYRSFAYITGEMNSSSNMERQMGFLNRLSERGTQEPAVLPGDYTYEAGYRALPRLLECTRLPCGVLCGNDLTAIGLIDAAREMHIRVPEDLGVVGFDNNFMDNWPVYQLTSLQSPTEELAREGVRLLLDRIQNNDLTPAHLTFDFKLVERGSTQLK